MEDRRVGRRRLALSSGLALLIHAALLMILPGDATPPGSSSKPMTIINMETGTAVTQRLAEPGPAKEPAGPEGLPLPPGGDKAEPPPPNSAVTEAVTTPPVTAAPDNPAIPEEEESRPGKPEAQPAVSHIGTTPNELAPPGSGLSGGPESSPAASDPAEEYDAGPSEANRPREFFPTRYLEPSYPEEARRNGIEGTVDVLLTVGRRGRVDSAELILTSGSDLLDNEVLRTVRLWRFSREYEGKQSAHRIIFRLDQ